MSAIRDGYEGDWIRGEKYEAGMVPEHSRMFDQALQNVVDKVPEDDNGPFDVRFMVTVRHDSPGWVDGYRADLDRHGGH
jgi:hypothetical protein